MQNKKYKILTFSESINEAISVAMKLDKKMVCYGLGATDPKGIFGTTLGLKKKFGSDRVFDVPASENALTGVSIGLALNNIRSIVTHQRLDFFILALDQLFNAAAKWHYMFGSKKSVSITIRLIIGRGWGQGPTHSQNYISWFRNVPNIKIFCPTFPSDIYQLLKKLPGVDGPVIIAEHRWLHSQKESFKNIKKKEDIFKSKILSKGTNLTVVSYSYSSIEIMKLYKTLKQNNISIDHIDLKTIKPLDIKTIIKSVKKTGKLLILDNMSFPYCSVGKDIISMISEKNIKLFKTTPCLLTLPDMPSPTSHFLTKNYYISEKKILNKIEVMVGKKIKNFKKKI